MKKILLSLLSIFLLQSASSSTTSNLEISGSQAGHILSSIIINLNSLTQVQYCQYKSILNSDETIETKNIQIAQDTAISNGHQAIGVNIENLRQIDLNSKVNDSLFMNELTTSFFNDLGYTDIGIINGGNPCNAYKWAMRACTAGFAICMADAAALCLGTGPFYWACIGPGALICAGGVYLCVEATDASYPNCVPNGKVQLNEWLSNSSSTCN